MGVSTFDNEKSQRKLETKYELTTTDGVKMFLEDLPIIESRRFFEADYAASDILIDLHQAIELIMSKKNTHHRLSIRQRQAMELMYIQGYTSKETAKIMGLENSMTAWEHAEKGCMKIAKQFEKWNYQHTGDDK